MKFISTIILGMATIAIAAPPVVRRMEPEVKVPLPTNGEKAVCGQVVPGGRKLVSVEKKKMPTCMVSCIYDDGTAERKHSPDNQSCAYGKDASQSGICGNGLCRAGGFQELKRSMHRREMLY